MVSQYNQYTAVLKGKQSFWILLLHFCGINLNLSPIISCNGNANPYWVWITLDSSDYWDPNPWPILGTSKGKAKLGIFREWITRHMISLYNKYTAIKLVFQGKWSFFILYRKYLPSQLFLFQFFPSKSIFITFCTNSLIPR